MPFGRNKNSLFFKGYMMKSVFWDGKDPVRRQGFLNTTFSPNKGYLPSQKYNHNMLNVRARWGRPMIIKRSLITPKTRVRFPTHLCKVLSPFEVSPAMILI